MKKLILYTLILLFFSQINAQKMGYVDTQVILKQMPQYQQSEDRLNAEVKKWQNEILSKQSNLDKLRTEYENEKVLLTEEQRKTKIAVIDSTEKGLNSYIEKKFGANGESTSLRRNLIKPLQDQIWNSINTLAAKDRYNFIFDKSSDLIMVFTDSKYDLTDKVIKQLGGISIDSEKDNKPGSSGKNSDSSKKVQSNKEAKNSGSKNTTSTSKSKSGYGSKYVPKSKQNANQETDQESVEDSESIRGDIQLNEGEEVKEEAETKKSGYGSKYVPKKKEIKKTEVKSEEAKKNSDKDTMTSDTKAKDSTVKTTEKKTTSSDTKSSYGNKYVPKKKEVKKTEEKTETKESVKEEEAESKEVETKETSTTETKQKSGYGSKYVPKKKK